MCGVVYILLYYVSYQSSLWLPDFNKLLVLSCLVKPNKIHASWAVTYYWQWLIASETKMCDFNFVLGNSYRLNVNRLNAWISIPLFVFTGSGDVLVSPIYKYTTIALAILLVIVIISIIIIATVVMCRRKRQSRHKVVLLSTLLMLTYLGTIKKERKSIYTVPLYSI